MIKDIAARCRSYRRFFEDEHIPRELLVSWVDTARVVASSANGQPLRYLVFDAPQDCERIFPNTAWAGALKDWPGPEEGERPSAYIVICCDSQRSLGERFTAWDEGIAAQTIMLAATEAGFGGCMIASFKKASVAELCGVAGSAIEPSLVLALGKPKEDVRLVEMGEDGSTTYYRDAQQVHYVPKRPLSDILIQR